MTTILIIRHGESQANKKDLFAGQIDPDLEERGHTQAEITAEYIKKNYKVDKVYSSDLTRAYKTALHIAEKFDLDVIKEKRLREIDGGKWEGIKFANIINLYPEEFSVWMNHLGQASCPKGESIQQVGERIMNVLTKIAVENEGKIVVATSHATPIRVAQSLIETGGLEATENLSWVSNASVTEIEYKDGKFTIKVLGEDHHLAELKTELPATI